MTSRTPRHWRRIRRLLLLLALGVASALLWIQQPVLYLPGYGSIGSDDFLQYWAAGRLVWRGGNPYDTQAMLTIEQAVGLAQPEPKATWNPPWTLALALPFALLPFGLASLLWLALNLGLLLLCGGLLWMYYAPGDRRPWVGLLLAAGFYPGLVALKVGQISPWLLVGIAGFLWAQDRRHDTLAGACLALLMIKPHYAYLFWLAALYWALRARRARVLAGWTTALVAASLPPLLLTPHIYADYLSAASTPPTDWATATLGAWLRWLFGLDRRWLQFLPSALGGLGLAAWLLQRRGAWHWRGLAAPLLLASAATASYGWSYDQVVLLPVAVDAAGHLRSRPWRARLVPLAGFLLIQAISLAQDRVPVWQFEVFDAWQPWALCALYAWTRWRCPRLMEVRSEP